MSLAEPEPDDPLDAVPAPPSSSQRWKVHRKAAVVQAVRGGYLSMYEMGKTHNISVDEFLAW